MTNKQRSPEAERSVKNHPGAEQRLALLRLIAAKVGIEGDITELSQDDLCRGLVADEANRNYVVKGGHLTYQTVWRTLHDIKQMPTYMTHFLIQWAVHLGIPDDDILASFHQEETRVHLGLRLDSVGESKVANALSEIDRHVHGFGTMLRTVADTSPVDVDVSLTFTPSKKSGGD